jgi:hypothetical protein
MPAQMLFQELLRKLHVVVEDHQDVAARFHDAAVTRRRRTRVLLTNDAQRESRRDAGQAWLDRFRRSVIDHDDLELVARERLLPQLVNQAFEGGPAVVSGEHHADARSVHCGLRLEAVSIRPCRLAGRRQFDHTSFIIAGDLA